MNFRLLMLSTMYPGSLEHFYTGKSGLTGLGFNEHMSLLLRTSSEFAASYIRNFRKLGIDSDCVIANDETLQKKWASEHGFVDKGRRELLLEQVKSFSPDILWIDNLGLVDEHWIKKIRGEASSVKLVAGYHCSPVNSGILSGLRGCDIIFTCTPGLKSLFESYGKITHLVYHGFDNEIADSAAGAELDGRKKVIFSGSLTTGDNFHQERIRLIEEILKSGIDLKLYVNLEKQSRIVAKKLLYNANSFFKLAGLSKLTGRIKILEHGKSKIENYSADLLRHTFPPVYGTDMYNLIRNSGIVLNYHIGVSGDYAGNMRMFEVTGLGSCLLTDNKKNLKDLFIPDCEVVAYDNPQDCIRKIRWLLENDKEREKIAMAGRERTLKEHTVEARCRIIIDVLQKSLDSVQ